MPKPKKVVVEHVDEDAVELINGSGRAWGWALLICLLIFLASYAYNLGPL